VFAEYGATTPRPGRAASSPTPGIHESRHNGPMREVPRGLKLRVVACTGAVLETDVLLLDERPTFRHQFDPLARKRLNNYDATMVIISHDRHF